MSTGVGILYLLTVERLRGFYNYCCAKRALESSKHGGLPYNDVNSNVINYLLNYDNKYIIISEEDM